jgi:integrase
MPTRALTDKFCRSAKPTLGERQTDFLDAGHKGLSLRISASAKTWTFNYVRGGKRNRLKLGSYPATSIAAARTRADEARRELEAGRDPEAIAAAAETLRSVGDAWLAREGSKLRTGEDRKAVLERAIYPVLGDRQITDIRRSEVVRLLDDITDSRGPAAAHKALEVLRRVFNWYAARSDDFHSPVVRGMIRLSPNKRDRILSDDEIRTVWAAAEGQGVFGRYVRFLLLTGARRTEASHMTWAELEGNNWTLPATRNKTGLPLLRPLSRAALRLIGTKPDNAVFVFSLDGGATPLSGYSELKIAFDRACGVSGWTLHDLRRTARSLLSRAGIGSDHAERVLGHVIGGVRAVYDRHEYHDEKRDALEKLARLVNFIIHRRIHSVTLRRVAQGGEANA